MGNESDIECAAVLHLAYDLRQVADEFEQGRFNFDKWQALIDRHYARKLAAEFVNSKDPDFWRALQDGEVKVIGKSLQTPKRLRILQRKLYRKAKEAAMSGDGKCRVVAWSRENARTNPFVNEWLDRMEARLKVSPDNMNFAEVLRITASDPELATVAFDEGNNVLSALSYLLFLVVDKAIDRACELNK
jgi:hypothetical protein